jgi:hypothetical protein
LAAFHPAPMRRIRAEPRRRQRGANPQHCPPSHATHGDTAPPIIHRLSSTDGGKPRHLNGWIKSLRSWRGREGAADCPQVCPERLSSLPR